MASEQRGKINTVRNVLGRECAAFLSGMVKGALQLSSCLQWSVTELLLNSGCCAADLKFKASSRMKPRWLVIAAVLPTQDVMYVQYNVPTIIMSRACDQLTKASLQALYNCFAICSTLTSLR